MIETKKYTFDTGGKNSTEVVRSVPLSYKKKNEIKKQFKKELLDVFHKFGYLDEQKDYEVNIRTTSGNIAWINIACIEIIK